MLSLVDEAVTMYFLSWCQLLGWERDLSFQVLEIPQ
jgi:hypothetical protein